jgi:hypothetical protein
MKKGRLVLVSLFTIGVIGFANAQDYSGSQQKSDDTQMQEQKSDQSNQGYGNSPSFQQDSATSSRNSQRMDTTASARSGKNYSSGQERSKNKKYKEKEGNSTDKKNQYNNNDNMGQGTY